MSPPHPKSFGDTASLSEPAEMPLASYREAIREL